MSIKIYTSSSVETLAKEFGNLYIKQENIFNPMLVVVGANTTKDWLKETIAKDKGIVANISFSNPNDLIVTLSKILGITKSTSDLLNPVQINWLLFSELGSYKFKANFPEIAKYYHDNELKRFALAEKVTSLFDKYQNLKPSLISNWNNLDFEPNNPDEIWQCFLWRAIIKKTESGFSERSKSIENILQILGNKNQNINDLISKLPSITFFGQIEYSEELILLLEALSNHIKVTIFRIEYAFDENESNQNRLVNNFGIFMKNQKELFVNTKNETILLQNYNATKSSLLGTLKNHMLQNNGIEKQSIDDSITINNCFSINREVEVLYNYLLKQFEEDASLGARDICVMIPNLSDYSSAIHAFFNSSKYEIKYTLYESNTNLEESPYAALLALLDLDLDNLTSEEVLKLLEYTYLRTKFEFSEDLSTVRRAVSLTNIKHGIDGNPNLETNLVSWRYGLKRLMYGICIKEEGILIQDGNTDFYTVNQFEGADANEIIRLYYFVEQVIKFIENRSISKTIREWVEFITQTTEDFLNTAEFDLTFFFMNLGKIDELSSYLEDEVIPFSVVQHFLKSILNEMENGSKKGTSGVRFTSLQPMMTAPAKIIAFLGMNNADFPRKQTNLSFDLASDVRSQADLEKQLFLNGLFVAEEKIYISYIGQSVKDNSSIPPSTVVDELRAAIKPLLNENCKIDDLVTKHPLHGFSTLYNNKPNMTRYFSQDNPINISKDDTNNNLEPFSNKMDVNDLYRFFTDPIKWYYNKTLGIYYNEEDATLAETELFSLNSLESWLIKDEVFNIPSFDESNIETYRSEKVKKGNLPLMQTGALVLQKSYSEIEQLKHLFEEIKVGNHNPTKLIGLTLGKYYLNGQITHIYGNRLVFGTVSKDKYKYRLQAILQYLFIVASGNDAIELYYLHIESSSAIVVSGISKEKAKNILEKWCGYFEMGQKNILPFSLDFCRLDKKTHSFFLDLIEKENANESTIIQFNKKLKELRNPSYGECYLSDYQKKEIDNNFFDNEANVSLFLKIYEDIIAEMNMLFNE
ncbi:exodeoxyribonuclease V subunit gamma [Flavobacterium chungnamense]|uniref:RecBCD enzyme subunit RecC n=1 Tax=Flavobacterium chungnamense TaxID=706182 RepID=A0ABP7UUF4_9FLAO